MSETSDSLIAYCRENKRVCPNPIYWNELWEMLPGRREIQAGWEPALPLILSAWFGTSLSQKRQRLEEHIRWAAANGSLERVSKYLRTLSEPMWLYEGEDPEERDDA